MSEEEKNVFVVHEIEQEVYNGQIETVWEDMMVYETLEQAKEHKRIEEREPDVYEETEVRIIKREVVPAENGEKHE